MGLAEPRVAARAIEAKRGGKPGRFRRRAGSLPIFCGGTLVALADRVPSISRWTLTSLPTYLSAAQHASDMRLLI